MKAEYFRLAFRNLTHRRMRSWLTMIGIFIGIAAVVSLISLGQGMEAAITQQFAALGANTITIQPKGGGFGPPGTLAATNLTIDDLEEINRVPGVDRAFGRLIKPMRMEFNSRTRFVFAATLPEETEDRQYIYDARNVEVLEGRLLDSNDRFKIIVGYNNHQENAFGRAMRVGDKVTVSGRSMDVVGLLDRTGSPEVDISIMMNEEDMRDILNIDEEYSAILARTSEGRDVDTVAASIERALRQSRDVEEGREDFNVETSAEILETFGTVLSIVQLVLVGIAAISLIVGGIGIMNTMFTAVLERTKEIGIMKAVGARNEDVLSIFIIESGLLGLTGGAIGVLLGMGLSKFVEYVAVNFGGIDVLQASFPIALILGALIFSFTVGTLSGIMPAIRASRMDPVEALRK